MNDDNEKLGQDQPGITKSESEKSHSTPLNQTKAEAPKDVPTGAIFETVPEDQIFIPPAPKNLKPEEVSSVSQSPDKVAPQQPPSKPPEPILIADEPPKNTNIRKYLMIGVGGVVFLFILIMIIWGIASLFLPKKQINLTYWSLWDDKAVVDPLIKDYESKHKHITIDYQKMDPSDYREKLVARSQNGRGPDIFRFHNTWLPEIGQITSPIPSNIMSTNEFERTFYPIHQKDLKIGKFYYGIPLSVDGLVLLYNEDLFKKAGIDQAPVSWEDVVDDATRLTVKGPSGNIITSGIALGTASNVDHFSDIFGLFLIQNGGDIRKLDQPEAVGALESYRKFAEEPDNMWDETMPPSVIAFTQEKVAMILAPTWQIQHIKTLNPQIKLKVTVVPIIPGSSPVSIASYWAEGVSSYSKNQKEAWQFLKFLSEKENMTKLYELQAKSRGYGAAYSRVDLGSTISQNEFVGPVIKQINAYISLPLISLTYDNGLNDQTISYIENAINATSQGVSYEEALQTAKQGIDQIFKKYGIQ